MNTQSGFYTMSCSKPACWEGTGRPVKMAGVLGMGPGFYLRIGVSGGGLGLRGLGCAW